MSERFCLIIYRDVPDGDDGEFTVECVDDVRFMEEPNHAAALASAYETVNTDKGDDPVARAKLVSVLDVTDINLDGEESKSELEKLREQVEELESKADGFDQLMSAIAELSGTDPRKVKPDSRSPFQFGAAHQAPLHDVAINLLYEAVRKKAEEMTKRPQSCPIGMKDDSVLCPDCGGSCKRIAENKWYCDPCNYTYER